MLITRYAKKKVSSKEEKDKLYYLRKKVEHLELEILMKDQQLQKERISHTKALQLEQERFHERNQALQLHLYISETRLKTFEDALTSHIDAVKKNTAQRTTTSSKQYNHQHHDDDTEYRRKENSKPLFLRTPSANKK